MKAVLAALALVVFACLPAGAASLTKTYSYFSVGGRTLDEIETELNRRGPQINGSGRRHPGATRMEFSTRVTYGESNGRCTVTDANVRVSARMFLPRWRNRKGSAQDVRLIWDTLSQDIKRHEESHIVIAQNYAREMESRLKRIGSFRNCEAAAVRAKEVSQQTLDEHDREQLQFDRVEGINFEKRLLRLLRYRLERMSDGRLPG